MTFTEFIEQYNALMRAFAPWSYLLNAAGIALGLALSDIVKHLWRRWRP